MHVSLTPGVTGNGTTSGGKKSSSWTQPADAVNSISVASFSAGNVSLSHPVSVSAVLSVDVTMTWTPDTSLPSDPSPDKIVVSEQSTAQASSATDSGAQGGTHKTMAGMAKDGLGDPTDATGTSTGHHYVPYAVSGGKVSLTLALSASAGASPPPGGTNPDGTSYLPGSCSAGASVGDVTISIHAQPYNFRSSGYDMNGTHYNQSVEDNTNAILSLSYIWSSTDGDNSHLTTCMIKENVTWNSNTAGVGQNHTNSDGRMYYEPPSPPVGKDDAGHTLAYSNPTVTQQPATNHGITDTFSPETAYTGPYTAISWWGDQTYVFSDSDTGETMTPLPGPAAGTFRITRTVAPTGTPRGTTGTLTISTRGHSAGPASLQ